MSVFHPGKAGVETGHNFALRGVGGSEGAVSKGGSGVAAPRGSQTPTSTWAGKLPSKERES